MKNGTQMTSILVYMCVCVRCIVRFVRESEYVFIVLQDLFATQIIQSMLKALRDHLFNLTDQTLNADAPYSQPALETTPFGKLNCSLTNQASVHLNVDDGENRGPQFNGVFFFVLLFIRCSSLFQSFSLYLTCWFFRLPIKRFSC